MYTLSEASTKSAAILENCDLIISYDTEIDHLYGGIRKVTTKLESSVDV